MGGGCADAPLPVLSPTQTQEATRASTLRSRHGGQHTQSEQGPKLQSLYSGTGNGFRSACRAEKQDQGVWLRQD